MYLVYSNYRMVFRWLWLAQILCVTLTTKRLLKKHSTFQRKSVFIQCFFDRQLCITSNKLWTLDYDNIPLQKVQFLLIAFNGDILFELSPMHSNVHNLSQMSSIDRKYNGHAWSKLVTTNIKNMFGLRFKKVCSLGHL